MRIVDPPDPDGLSEEAAAERARLALRAASVRFSIEATPTVDLTSPFSTGIAPEPDDQPLFAT